MEYTNKNNAFTLNRRGGVPVTKTNKDSEYYAKKMATRWASRNLELASRLELVQAQTALVGYGVVVDGQYSAAATLLNRVNTILARPIV